MLDPPAFAGMTALRVRYVAFLLHDPEPRPACPVAFSLGLPLAGLGNERVDAQHSRFEIGETIGGEDLAAGSINAHAGAAHEIAGNAVAG